MAQCARRALAACAAGALVLLLGTADAQTTRTAAQAERERRAAESRAGNLRSEAEAARRDIRALDARLADAARRRAEAEAAAVAAEERLTALETQIGQESLLRLHAEEVLERALIAAAFAERRVDPRAVRAGLVARAAAPEFITAAARSSSALADARRLQVDISAEQTALSQAQASIDAERAEIAGLLAERRSAQTRLTRELASTERRARALAAEARTLRELAQRVQRQSRPTATAAPLPAAWLAPAEGRISRSFGAREAGGPASQGAVVRTRAGAQVISPATGDVAYAGEFRSYGQVLILNLDGGYALVLAGLGATTVRAGEAVRAGQPVGEMSASATPAPELYVEVRRGGQPVDPGRWLNARGLTAESGMRAG